MCPIPSIVHMLFVYLLITFSYPASPETESVFLRFFFFCACLKFIILARQDSIQENSQNGCDSKRSQCNACSCDRECKTICKSKCADKDNGCTT